MSKHYYIGGQRIATRVSAMPSHRFKIEENSTYSGLRHVLEEEVKGIAIQAQYPQIVWVPNADTQGTYTSPSNTLANEADCDYVIEQLIISFSQDPEKESCYKSFLNKYNDVLSSGGSFCALLNEITNSNPDGCLTGETIPEILSSEMYWIHPDHLGSSSVLTNSISKITNWYEYIPFGESLMELSNNEYGNPYKYNGKEFDSQTGWYYYGARYYDPQRSFWLSVDPLVEITMSPYAYTWNDPVNYTDPTGMMGERIGEPGGPNTNKVYDGGVIEEIVLKGKKLNWLQRVGRFLGLGNSPSRNATAGTIPTMSQAPSGRTNNTLGQWTQAYRDYQPSSTDMFGQVMKPIINGSLDVANYLRNVSPLSDKRDYNGLAPRMTKWDGNTMSGTEGEEARGTAIVTAGGYVLGGVTSLGATSESVAAGSINYMKSSDRFAKFAAKSEPQAGALDVIGHGGPNIFEVNGTTIDGGAKLVNHRVLAKLIKQNPEFVGQDIRLLSCNTGEADFAQNLANKLNTNVYAPNKTLFAWPSGRLGVYPANAQGLPVLSQPGKIIKFTPKK